MRYLGRHVIWRPETSKVQWSVRRACQGMVTAMLLTKPSTISNGAPRDSKSSLTAWKTEGIVRNAYTGMSWFEVNIKYGAAKTKEVGSLRDRSECIESALFLYVYNQAEFLEDVSFARGRPMETADDVPECCCTRVQLRNCQGCTSSTKTAHGDCCNCWDEAESSGTTFHISLKALTQTSRLISLMSPLPL